MDEKIEQAEEYVRESVRQYRPSHKFVLFSGGDDSLVMTHLLMEVSDVEFDGVFHMDTETGLSANMAFIRSVADRYGWNLIVYSASNNDPPQRYRDLVLPPDVLAGETSPLEKGGFPTPTQHQKYFDRLKGRSIERLVADCKQPVDFHREADEIIWDYEDRPAGGTGAEQGALFGGDDEEGDDEPTDPKPGPLVDAPPGADGNPLPARASEQRLISDGTRHPRYDRIFLASGIRAGESQNRMPLADSGPINKRKTQVWVNPILYWSREDLEQYRHDHDLPRNPIAEKNCDAKDCLCSCYANPGELDELRAFYEDDIQWLLELREEVMRIYPWDWDDNKPPDWWLEAQKDQGFLFEPDADVDDWVMDQVCGGCRERFERGQQAQEDGDLLDGLETQSIADDGCDPSTCSSECRESSCTD